MTSARGQHFLQIPGPSPVPERVMRAMGQQVIDHRGPSFETLMPANNGLFDRRFPG
jgi:alanine-glyoxylate transaminase / serine-glyoxylate transaminase / serine-pyruvate transaminase